MAMQHLTVSTKLPEWIDPHLAAVVIARDRREMESALQTAALYAGDSEVAYRYSPVGGTGYVLFYFQDGSNLREFEHAIWD